VLRREFGCWREWKRQIEPVGRKVLVTMGGSDPDNFTTVVIDALRLVRVEGLEAIVVLGGCNPYARSLEQSADQFAGAVRLRRSVSNMAELMGWADVAISGAGTTCLEMCLLGLPAILIDLAENQRPIAHELERTRCAIYLGESGNVSVENVATKLEWFLLSPEIRAACSRRARDLVDGQGAARVVSVMQNRQEE
jgi:spore coat polysaccharide biosynthesis predicted glycosyltransferase SpsG